MNSIGNKSTPPGCVTLPMAALVLSMIAGEVRAEPSAAQVPARAPIAAAATSVATQHPASREHALALLDEALTVLEQSGDWLLAKDKLEQARANAEFPNILFHLARACFRVGDHERGTAALARYEELAGPYNPHRAAAKRLHADHALAAALPAAQRVPPPQAPLPLGPLLTIGSGGVALVAALITGLLANASDGELARNCEAALHCPSYLKSVRDNGQRLKTATNVLLGVGVATIGAGTGWWLLGPEKRVEARVACSGDGCQAATRVQF